MSLDGNDGARHACESTLGVALSVAEPSESLKSLRTRIRQGGRDGTAVRRAVGVRETHRRGSRARDEQPPFMDGEVVSRAEGHEVVGVMRAAFAARFDVVRHPESRMPAPQDTTFPAVAGENPATGCRGDVLGCASESHAHVVASVFGVDPHVGIDVPDVLTVALRHLEDLGTDLMSSPWACCFARRQLSQTVNAIW